MLLLHQTLHTSSMILNINIHLKRQGAVETGAKGVRTFTYRRVLTTIRLYTRIAAGIKKMEISCGSGSGNCKLTSVYASVIKFLSETNYSNSK